MLASASFLVLIIVSLEKNELYYNNIFLQGVFYSLILLITTILLTGPFLITFSYIFNGFKIIKMEGFAFRNLLSLSIGLLLLINLLFWPRIAGLFEKYSFWYMLYIYIDIFIAYFLILSSSYTLSSWLNFFNKPSKHLDYVVVLGSGLNGDKVTPLLASRINKGINVYKKNKGSKLIMSGGKGSDEVISEAEAMKRYALMQGVKDTDIILENKSTSTEENLRFSRSLMNENSEFAIVTNYYHLFRALLIARNEKIKCIGYGAKTKLYFSMNAFVREFIGYLYLKRKLHLIVSSIITATYFIFMISIKLLIK